MTGSPARQEPGDLWKGGTIAMPEAPTIGGPTSRTPKPHPGATPEFDTWSQQEQAELEQIHTDYLARLKANEPVRRHYEAISADYKKKHLEHLRHYSSTASSRRSSL